MRKIISFFILLSLILFNFNYYEIFSNLKESKILYNDNKILLVNYHDYTDRDKLIEKITKESKLLNINVMQHVYLDDNSLNIYSTNIEVDKNISVAKGNYYNKLTDDYISNVKSKDENNVGIVKFPKTKMDIKIYDFLQINNVGLGNKFIINCNGKDINEIKNIFDEFGKVTIIDKENYLMLNVKLILIVCLFLSILLFVLVNIVYVLYSKKRIVVQKLLGYSHIPNSTSILFPIILEFCIKSLVISSVTSIYYYLVYSYRYGIEYILMSNFFVAIFLLIYGFFAFTISICISKNINIKTFLNGKSYKNNFEWLLLFNKAIIFILLLFSVSFFSEQYSYLNSRLGNIDYWNKAKNVYKTFVSNQGQEKSIEIERSIHIKLSSLYKELNNKGAFLIDSTNYSLIIGKDKKPEYFYMKNLQVGNYRYGSDGESIIINENYLKQNPIKTSENIDVFNYFSEDENTLNILVPEKYKSEEEKLYKDYLSYFYFRKVEVNNIFNKALDTPLNKTQISELKVNIIYVKDNQKYFTYSSQSGRDEEKHYITDPIVIIYDEKIDISSLAAYFSKSLYFIDESNGSAYKNILPYLKETDTRSIIPGVDSVYKSVNDEIITINKRNRDILLIIVLLTVCTVFFSVIYIILYYINNSYKIYLKIIFGEYFINIYISSVYKILLINSIAIYISSFFIKSNLIFIMGFSVTIAELILVYFLSIYLKNQSINKIIKGEK